LLGVMAERERRARERRRRAFFFRAIALSC
jgi:hypothetical protein